MSKRVLQGKNRAQECPSNAGDQVKVLPHLVEIFDVGIERDFLGQHLISGSPTAPLVVVDEPECIRQSIQVGQEIGAGYFRKRGEVRLQSGQDVVAGALAGPESIATSGAPGEDGSNNDESLTTGARE